jgi:hypothetical protein
VPGCCLAHRSLARSMKRDRIVGSFLSGRRIGIE